MCSRVEELINRHSNILRGVVDKDWFEIEQEGTSFTFTLTVMELNLVGQERRTNPGAIAWALKVHYPRLFPADKEPLVFCIGDSSDNRLLHYVVNTQIDIEVIYVDNNEGMN